MGVYGHTVPWKAHYADAHQMWLALKATEAHVAELTEALKWLRKEYERTIAGDGTPAVHVLSFVEHALKGQHLE